LTDERENSKGNVRAQWLDEAWGLGAQGHYGYALAILEGQLSIDPRDVGALRMMGNLLELKELERLEYSSKRLTSSSDFMKARRCYESILKIHPNDVKARIDLGDHFKNLGAIDQALMWYREAVSALRQATDRNEDWLQEVQELGDAIALLGGHDRLGAEARNLEAWCKSVYTFEL
jgi:tetratricopeptide (TPR) repeat protein